MADVADVNRGEISIHYEGHSYRVGGSEHGDAGGNLALLV